MKYSGDSLLPLLMSEIKKRVAPLMTLSKQDENKIFGLSESQKRFIAEGDARAKIEYLAQPPTVTSAGVKASETYKNITKRMKSRIEASYKI